MHSYTALNMPYGSVGLVASPTGLCHVYLFSGPASRVVGRLANMFPRARYDERLMPLLQDQLIDYFDGQAITFKVKLDLSACTTFQHTVLEACARIPYGQTLTYGQLAAGIGRPKASRAVGGALARNPVPLLIPCHRVVAGSGRWGGFSAEQGVSLKKKLLALEARSADLTDVKV